MGEHGDGKSCYFHTESVIYSMTAEAVFSPKASLMSNHHHPIYRHTSVDIHTPHIYMHSTFSTIQHGRNYLGMRNFKDKCFQYLNCKYKVTINSLSSKWSLSFLQSIPGSWGKDWAAGHGLFHHLVYHSTSVHMCVVLDSKCKVSLENKVTLL